MCPSSSFGSQAPDPDVDGWLFKRACSGPVYVLPGVETLIEFDVICEFWIRPSDTPTGITSEQSHFLDSVVDVVVDTSVVVGKVVLTESSKERLFDYIWNTSTFMDFKHNVDLMGKHLLLIHFKLL